MAAEDRAAQFASRHQAVGAVGAEEVEVAAGVGKAQLGVEEEAGGAAGRRSRGHRMSWTLRWTRTS